MSQIRRRASSKAEYTFRINRVLAYIENNLSDDLSLGMLARASFFSPFHFHRIFQSIVGETPVEFVKRLRLERSALMLMHNPDLSATAIALACGFSSSATFARAFGQKFGMSPTAWRKSAPGEQKSRKRKASAPEMRYLRSVKPENYKIKLMDLPAKHIAFVANLEGYIEEKIDRAWNRLCSWAEPAGLLEGAEFIGISFDNPDITPMKKCRYYACITIPAGTVPPKDIGVMDLLPGRYAVLSFDGPPEDIGVAYRSFYGAWLPQSGFQPDDRPCYERYHSTPEEDPEGHFVMEICMPVKPLQKGRR